MGTLDARRKRSSFVVALRGSPASQRRRWPRSVREFQRQSLTTSLPHAGIFDVPSVFLLAEKMWLKSAERMRPIVIIMAQVLFAGEASIMFAEKVWIAGVGYLVGGGFVVLVSLIKSLLSSQPRLG